MASATLKARARDFTGALVEWYRRNGRDLPWRRTSNPYAIWVSEVMLQQTRVETVIPYYERFLASFPDLISLASSSDERLLAAWAGLGYYSRVRNMRRAAKRMLEAGGFPSDYDAIRALPGVGDYTAAAVASIAFGAPHAVLDGNVMRVMARITGDAADIRSPRTRARLHEAAASRLDLADPATFNQAVMELGATLCTSADPKCLLCPVSDCCAARAAGRERELPVKSRGADRKVVQVTLLIAERGENILLWQRPAGSPRLAGFWELPEPGMLNSPEILDTLGGFRHSITNTSYRFTVVRARVTRKPPELEWTPLAALGELPLSTTTRKALALRLPARARS